MSGEIVDDPMDVQRENAGVDMDTAQNDDSQQLDDMVLLEERSVTPVAETVKNQESLGGCGNADRRDEDISHVYDLQVNTEAVDIETILANYGSIALQLRLEFLIDHCPPIRREAILALIDYIRDETQNISKYTQLFKDLEDDDASKQGKGKSNALPMPKFDSKWIDETSLILSSRFDGLQGEYKRQKDEGVKESTRRAMEELFQHYMKAGQFEDCLRLYARGIRDYCTQFKHSINMWTNWLEISIVVGDYSKIELMSNQAAKTIRDAEKAERANSSSSQRNENAIFMIERDAIVHANNQQSNRILVESALAKVLAVQAINKVRAKEFKQAAEKVLEISMDNLEAKWFVTPADLGIYALLCCLATFSRTELKKVMEKGTFRKLLESEPQFFEILTSYISSNFGKCFELLTSVQQRLLLDPFISQHINELYSKIRQKCVVQYLKPYSTIRLDTMSKSLGYTVKEIEKIVIELIESGEINVKIDQMNGVLRNVDNTDEKSTQRRVLEVCKETLYKTNIVHWKSMLTQANIVSFFEKEPRGKRRPKYADSGSRDDYQGNGNKRYTCPNLNDESIKTADEADFSPSTEADNLIVEEPNVE